MKAMMMITGLIFLAGIEAQAGLSCVRDLGPGQPKVKFTEEGNGKYTISMYGHSRNTYKATYQLEAPLPYKFWEKLVKVEDRSTWKDMPESLSLGYVEVSHTDIGFTYVLKGLFPGVSVEFNEFEHCIPAEAYP